MTESTITVTDGATVSTSTVSGNSKVNVSAKSVQVTENGDDTVTTSAENVGVVPNGIKTNQFNGTSAKGHVDAGGVLTQSSPENNATVAGGTVGQLGPKNTANVKNGTLIQSGGGDSESNTAIISEGTQAEIHGKENFVTADGERTVGKVTGPSNNVGASDGAHVDVEGKDNTVSVESGASATIRGTEAVNAESNLITVKGQGSTITAEGKSNNADIHNGAVANITGTEYNAVNITSGEAVVEAPENRVVVNGNSAAQPAKVTVRGNDNTIIVGAKSNADIQVNRGSTNAAIDGSNVNLTTVSGRNDSIHIDTTKATGPMKVAVNDHTNGQDPTTDHDHVTIAVDKKSLGGKDVKIESSVGGKTVRIPKGNGEFHEIQIGRDIEQINIQMTEDNTKPGFRVNAPAGVMDASALREVSGPKGP